MRRAWWLLPALLVGTARGGELTVELKDADRVVLVGAMRRWEPDGRPVAPVDPKAHIDEPRVDAKAERTKDGRWIFANLPPGTYDLVILTNDRERIEGFRYPPVLEFDPILPPDAPPPDDDAREEIGRDIRLAKHYENKVSPLHMAAGKDQARVLMQLVRDLPTSYDAEYGRPVATVRHEVWQYTLRYGRWSKERKTAVLDRVLLAKAVFYTWTWIWEPKLGGVAVGKAPAAVEYALPARFDPGRARGWFPVK